MLKITITTDISKLRIMKQSQNTVVATTIYNKCFRGHRPDLLGDEKWGIIFGTSLFC